SNSLTRPVIRLTKRLWQARESRPSPGPTNLSTNDGIRGRLCLRLRCRADRLGRNFESILVHIESLLPVQAFDKLTCSLTDGSRKTRRLHFGRRFHCFFISISIAKLHLKRYHAPNLPFLTVSFKSDDVFDSQLASASSGASSPP